MTDTQTTTVVYALTVTGRAGRWEIEAIDPAPAHKPASVGCGPADLTSGGEHPATGSSSSTHHNP